MKPILDLTVGHITKQIRIQDQHLAIEGTLTAINGWSEYEEIQTWAASKKPARVLTSTFLKVEFYGIPKAVMITRQAQFEVID